MLHLALRDYEIYCLSERNHQGLSNRLVEPSNVVELRTGAIPRRDRLGDLLTFHYREAA